MAERLPRGSCDCHLHVFGDPDRYPPIANSAYPPPPATPDRLERLHSGLGIERAVLVQPMIYGVDHRMLLDALRGRPQYRGVAVVNDRVSDRELRVLHEAGIRAARFNLGGAFGAMSRDELERSTSRVRELGWHAKFGGMAKDFIANRDWLGRYDGVAVLDHLAGLTPADGVDGELMGLIRELLRNDNWWILLANADRRSQAGPGWDDMLATVQALVAAAPGRALWATDWPHVLYGQRVLPDDAMLVAFLRRAVPDPATLEDILVHNPARLYGFDP
jgi:predicted TIM-barrel fold metal-dependent hydrolase